MWFLRYDSADKKSVIFCAYMVDFAGPVTFLLMIEVRMS